ncbi:MAG TPA: flavodoxin domain-containing protein [Bacteroidales bacterium]|nr:flavodoxin domain-containing protein [Bacteroidales bacterium]
MDKRSFIKRGILGTAAFLISGKAYNLEYYPAASSSKWAVLYGTWCGSTRDASLWISEGMDGIANVFDVRENPDLSGYEHLIIGGAIRMGAISPELSSYIEKNRSILKSKIRGLFAVCGNMMQPLGPEQTKSLIDDHLARICGVTGVPSKVFLGRVTFGLMEPDVRKQMQSMPGMKEYDNLKRSDCMAFGKEVFSAIKS